MPPEKDLGSGGRCRVAPDVRGRDGELADVLYWQIVYFGKSGVSLKGAQVFIDRQPAELLKITTFQGDPVLGILSRSSPLEFKLWLARGTRDRVATSGQRISVTLHIQRGGDVIPDTSYCIYP